MTTPDHAEALLPCPFCGWTVIDPHAYDGEDSQYKPIYNVRCEGCAATASSIKDWNTRSDPKVKP